MAMLRIGRAIAAFGMKQMRMGLVSLWQASV